MNTINRISVVILSVLVSLSVVSCDKTWPEENPYLTPSEAAISGTWMLAEHCVTARGTEPYVYLVLERSDMTFTMYSNVNSGAAQCRTGNYTLSGEDGKYIITGMYDHGGEFWNSDYYITELTADRMVWTVTDNPADVSVYIRCESVPEDIL